MNIGINILYLYPNAVGGTETYARGLIEGLKSIDKKNNYYIFCNKECAPTFKGNGNFTIVRLPISARNRIRRSLFEFFVLPYYLLKYNLHLLHSLGYSSPIFSHCPKIVNIYDLNWYYHPEDFSFVRRIGWKLSVIAAAKFCTLIVTSSYSSRRHIAKVLSVSKNRINVIYGGTPKMPKPYGRDYLVNIGIEGEYVFTLTADIPHKNIIGLLNGYSVLFKKGKKYKLVIAGLRGEVGKLAREYIDNHEIGENIVILGWVNNRELATLYKYSSCFVFPSLHEGFGFPVIEAFSLGVPVASSNAFSLKELVSDSGLLFNPRKEKEIASALDQLMSSTSIRSRFAKKGLLRAEYFKWSESAGKALDIYNALVAHR